MTKEFRKPSPGERFQQIGYLLKNTVTIIGRDTDIVGPFLRTAIYAVVMVTAFFGGIAAIALGAGGTGTLLLLASLAMFVYKYFYYTRQDMAQSWLVAETVRGRDAVPGDGRKRVRGVKSQARILGWVSMGFAFISSRAANGEGGGLSAMVSRVLLSALSEVWDLAKHFLTPAVAIDECGLRDGVERMKSLKNSVPETLVGVFGIDIAGGAAGMLIAPVYVVLVMIAIALGFAVGDAIPAFYAGDMRDMLGASTPFWMGDSALSFSWLPLLIALWLSKMLGAILARVVDSAKTIYFTLFYMRITHSDEIAPDIREELDTYLRIESKPAADNTATQA
ncbi:hypothetical protein [Marinobacter sp. S6332]|uniref:hypothetical protein n=1 Tax=Marinobacter sp. S6332 TaxID=2926403 RepID=UPI001FF44FB8|nr:hypothetical protein [Marinobacter sp. S6332]MCK0163016.1 hypothetical protein [Marinobacter sp. S6332]